MLTAWLFALDARDGSARLGWGLLCPEARYASVRASTGGAIARRFAAAETWREISQAVSVGVPPTALERSSPIARLLAGDDAARVTYVRTVPVEPEPPETVAGRLDAALQQA